MPAVVAAAAVTAGAHLVGSELSARGTRAAGRSQERSNRESLAAQERATEKALAWEREKEAERKREHAMALAAYQAQWNAWNQARAGMMQRYGVNPGPVAQMPGTPPSAAPGVTIGGLAGRPAAAPVRMGRPVAGGASMITPTTPPGGLIPPPAPPVEPPITIADLENWNDWEQHARRREA